MTRLTRKNIVFHAATAARGDFDHWLIPGHTRLIIGRYGEDAEGFALYSDEGDIPATFATLAAAKAALIRSLSHV